MNKDLLIAACERQETLARSLFIDFHLDQNTYTARLVSLAIGKWFGLYQAVSLMTDANSECVPMDLIRSYQKMSDLLNVFAEMQNKDRA